VHDHGSLPLEIGAEKNGGSEHSLKGGNQAAVYLSRREDLMALASVIASKRETKAPAEAQAARILFSRIKNERLG